MKEVVAEWIMKAEADFGSAKLLLKPDSTPHNYDLVCFLSQQCVEKYLKAYLQSIDVEFNKTHDLSVLLDLTLESQPLWEAWRTNFRRLKEFAVEFRYPGEWAEKQDATASFEIAKSFRKDARAALDC
jgi:HEPN domain-containing protein